MEKILTVFDKQPTGLHFTTEHNGKMAGMQSLSTSCTVNPQCKKNAQIPGSICAHCFSFRMMRTYGNTMRTPYEKNYQILNSGILDDSAIPYFTGVYGRFEAFGDLGSAIQCVNYFKIAKHNPQTKFAIWTKNPKFVAAALKIESKPENLQIIYSSLFLNTCNVPKYDFIDKVFTVYDKKTAKDQGINVNCGARSCFLCGRCYNSNPAGVKVQMINEILK